MNLLNQLKFQIAFLLFSLVGITVSAAFAQPDKAYADSSILLNQKDSLQEEIILYHPSKIEHNEPEKGSYSILADSIVYTAYPKGAISLQLLLEQEQNQTTKKKIYWMQILIYTGISLLATLFLYIIWKSLRYRKQRNIRNKKFEELKEKAPNQQLHGKEQTEKLQSTCNEKNQYFYQLMATLPFYQTLTYLLKDHKDKLHTHELIHTELWKEAISTIDHYTNHFSNRLQQEYNQLKPEDIRFCCLIKIGLKYSDIACLLGRTPNMMYKRRDVIMDRMEINISKAHFDDFIKNF